MENPPFEDVFPYSRWGFSIAMFVYRRVLEGFLISFCTGAAHTFWAKAGWPASGMVDVGISEKRDTPGTYQMPGTAFVVSELLS